MFTHSFFRVTILSVLFGTVSLALVACGGNDAGDEQANDLPVHCITTECAK